MIDIWSNQNWIDLGHVQCSCNNGNAYVFVEVCKLLYLCSVYAIRICVWNKGIFMSLTNDVMLIHELAAYAGINNRTLNIYTNCRWEIWHVRIMKSLHILNYNYELYNNSELGTDKLESNYIHRMEHKKCFPHFISGKVLYWILLHTGFNLYVFYFVSQDSTSKSLKLNGPIMK